MCASAVALRAIAATARCATSGVTCVDSRIRAHPSTALKGVRISCDTIARKSSLRWLAVSASSLSRLCAHRGDDQMLVGFAHLRQTAVQFRFAVWIDRHLHLYLAWL